MVAQLVSLKQAQSEDNQIEIIRQFLNYPIKQRDSFGSRFWLLRPGKTEEEAQETCPIAISFSSELERKTDKELKQFLTSDEQEKEIRGHYIKRTGEDQPVMYLLLPTNTSQGRVAFILPTEGKLRQRCIQTFTWDDKELTARLERLKQESLETADKIVEKALNFVSQVDWIFYKSVRTAKELAQELAQVTLRLEQAIPRIYKNEGKDGYLHKLFKSFQDELLPNLKLASDDAKDYSFADIYAQTISYGLFTARVFGYQKDEKLKKKTDFNRFNAWEQLPVTNPFLRDLFRSISQHSKEALDEELLEAIGEIFGILRAAKMDAILSDFRLKMNREDIVIHFYEEFICAYKPQMRESRGVYYTPKPVVSYIVRSVDHILKNNFGLKDGLADASKIQVKSSNGKETKEAHKVLITDVATGTATFLHEAINQIHTSFESKPEQWSDYVSQDLLPRLLGFELLMAPYAVAHMKLGLQLAELGYQFDTEERLRVYLTNTLQEAFRIPPAEDSFSSLIWGEADAANRIKEIAPVMVIMGNPPYSGHSANNGEWIKNLLKGKDILTEQQTSSYFEVDGKPLGEKNPKWLNDDYVKFIRFAQWRIEKTGYGILAFVTNHGYLDNPTFRGMRQSLMKTFDDIYVLDLHGNSKKKECCPDGSKDENVFDIQQGVAVGIFVKHPNGKKENATIHHADLWGMREVKDEQERLIGGKYHWLEKNDLSTTQWTKLKPQSLFYLFVTQNTDLLAEYEKGWKITEIMPVNVLGFQTHRDKFAIDFEQEKLYKRFEEMRDESISEREYAARYDLKDNRDWKLNEACKAIRHDEQWQSKLISCSYRPFDRRSCYFSTVAMDYPRRELVNHIAGKDNLCLLSSRQQATLGYRHCWVANEPAESCVVSTTSREGNQVFPLYLYPDTESSQQSVQRQPNFSQEFLRTLNNNIGYTPTPEAIFYYIYAILHSSTYRTRYAEFLKIDFPRVPLTSNDELFRQLSDYGEQLVQLHLMTSPKLDNLITEFVEATGNRTVDPAHPKYNNGAVTINKKGDKFTGVPEEVWNFYVGGYQPGQKWLKDRKGRTLSDEDILHYQQIVISLKETIELMAKIDEAIPGFPID